MMQPQSLADVLYRIAEKMHVERTRLETETTNSVRRVIANISAEIDTLNALAGSTDVQPWPWPWPQMYPAQSPPEACLDSLARTLRGQQLTPMERLGEIDRVVQQYFDLKARMNR